jgi:hypothetical protein
VVSPEAFNPPLSRGSCISAKSYTTFCRRYCIPPRAQTPALISRLSKASAALILNPREAEWRRNLSFKYGTPHLPFFPRSAREASPSIRSQLAFFTNLVFTTTTPSPAWNLR